MSSVGFWIRVTDPESDPCSLQATIFAGIDAMDIHEWDTWDASTSSYAHIPVSFVKFPINQGVFSTPDIAHDVTLVADDGNGLTYTFHFVISVGPIPNVAPTIGVTTGTTPLAVNDGSHLPAYYGAGLADLALVITVDDNDVGNQVSLSANINRVGGVGVGTTGILASEFSSPLQTVAYQLFPASGNFDTPSVSYRIDLVATDNNPGNPSHAFFTFFIDVSGNHQPVITVTSMGNPVLNGATLTVPFGSTMSGINLAISASDPDGDDCAIAANILNTTLQLPDHPVAPDPSVPPQPAEFVVPAYTPVPATVHPLTGVFDAHFGSTHQVSLTIQDTEGGSFNFVFVIAAGPETATAEIEVRESSLGGVVVVDDAVASSARDFGLCDIHSGPTVPITVCVVNNGDSAMNLSVPTVTGVDAADFVLNVGGFTPVVAAGGFAFFQMSFDPSTHDPVTHNDKLAEIVIQHDGWNDFIGDDQVFVVRVTGESTDGGNVTITTSALNIAIVNESYSTPPLTATGGIAPYTWSLEAGSTLPPGIVLTPQGYLLGGATGPLGTFQFTLRCTDVVGTYAVRSFSLTVDDDLPPPEPPAQYGLGGGGNTCSAAGGVAPWLLLALLGVAALPRLARRRS
ncbi:MAG: hypothetical protein IT462_01755 [Planctomycetes bacterium]|nr:hypothetical protein [Planctomycetota bacterium]